MWVEENRWHGDVAVLNNAFMMPAGATQAIKDLPGGAICGLPMHDGTVSVIQGRQRAKCLKMDCGHGTVIRVFVWRSRC